jgi:hypothetical protein
MARRAADGRRGTPKRAPAIVTATAAATAIHVAGDSLSASTTGRPKPTTTTGHSAPSRIIWVIRPSTIKP